MTNSEYDDRREERSAPNRERYIRRSIENLTPQQQSRMATLVLAGYSFSLGRVYWAAYAPDRSTLASLEDTLNKCIAIANEDHNRKVVHEEQHQDQ